MLSYNVKEPIHYSPVFDVLIYNMIQIRLNTFFLVGRLSTSQLDYSNEYYTNSIGSLFLHINFLQFEFLITHLEKRFMTNEEIVRYTPAFQENLVKKMIKNHPINYYTGLMLETRDLIIKHFMKKDDDWLLNDKKGKDNIYSIYRHLLDDELSHQGQIKLIKKQIIKRKVQ